MRVEPGLDRGRLVLPADADERDDVGIALDQRRQPLLLGRAAAAPGGEEEHDDRAVAPEPGRPRSACRRAASARTAGRQRSTKPPRTSPPTAAGRERRAAAVVGRPSSRRSPRPRRPATQATHASPEHHRRQPVLEVQRQRAALRAARIRYFPPAADPACSWKRQNVGTRGTPGSWLNAGIALPWGRSPRTTVLPRGVLDPERRGGVRVEIRVAAGARLPQCPQHAVRDHHRHVRWRCRGTGRAAAAARERCGGDHDDRGVRAWSSRA